MSKLTRNVVLRPREIRLLLRLLDGEAETGYYFGNREQYYAKVKRLTDRLEAALDKENV